MSENEISALREGGEFKPGAQSTIVAPTDETQNAAYPRGIVHFAGAWFVVFPGTVVPLNVQRAASLKLPG